MAKYKCNIGKYLESKGITQKELAEAIGTTEVSVSRYVNGDRIPKATTCIEIAKALDCEFEDLYSIENPKQTNADRIRNMSDEELAEFLCGVFDEDECNGKYICGITIPDYDEYRIAEWLKSEVKE